MQLLSFFLNTWFIDTHKYLALIFFPLLVFRIQTGKLSEFLTTSCFAHLSFLDVKGPGSGGYNEDESEEGDGYVHELRYDDGED